jgi:hypothetical protein
VEPIPSLLRPQNALLYQPLMMMMMMMMMMNVEQSME